MKTAEALEGMTDTGQFEILAIRSLRELDADCGALVHSGVNELGKTIPNPHDAFCLVPGSDPPRYVMAEFTLTSTDGLRKKWMYDHTTYEHNPKRKTRPPTQVDDGDLIKASREAAKIRATHSDATFVVWLCTNQHLESELQCQVDDKAAELGVKVQFLEQSKLRDFLDVKPEGQWLRQEHLGIQADQMSRPLLHRLAQDSLNLYANELLLSSLAGVVPTQSLQTATEAIADSGTLHLLLGPSGIGKSVIGFDLLRKHIADGGVGLWIPARTADQEGSLSGALAKVLQSLHPRAGAGAGHETLRLSTADHPLLLIVDDVNRSPSPVTLLRKLVAWSQPATSTEGVVDTTGPVKVVCPTWDAHWYPVLQMCESLGWVGVQRVGPMARIEAISCLKANLGERAGAYTDAELGAFADRLHDDPILLGLFAGLLRDDPSVNPLAVAENVIGLMIEQAVRDLAAATRVPSANYSTALTCLATELIRKKTLYPAWRDVQGWFKDDPDIRACLEHLVVQGHVCRLAEETQTPRLEFRHDRILEHHLAQAASGMLLAETDDRDALADPFFTPFVGRALARENLPTVVLEWAMQQNPCAVIAAVPHLPTSQSEHADKIVALARAWLAEREHSPTSMQFDALLTLANVNSPRVLEITRDLPPHMLLYEARLRNGDAEAGVIALCEDFYPGTSYSWLESLIEDARTHHGTHLIEQLRIILRASALTDQRRLGALCLAGYLGDDQLTPDIRVAWDNANGEKDVLLAALWASFRCAGDGPAELLDAIMPSILTLEHDKSGKSMSEQGSLLDELQRSSRHGFSEAVLTYLVDFATGQEGFKEIIGRILNDVDHPIAVRYMVRLLAEMKRGAKEAGGHSPWAMIWGNQWERKAYGNKGVLSPASVAALRSLWADEQSPEWLQTYAFSCWALCVDDVSELAAVDPESQHFDTAAWQRALHGDRAVAGYVLQRLDAKDHWYTVVSHVWGDEFEPAVDSALGKIAANANSKAESGSDIEWYLADLLRDIPTSTAERLLKKHWDGLGELRRFIQSALYHGTEEFRELAARSLAETKPGLDPLKHIGHFFGFQTWGRQGRLTQRHLETLLPHLQRLDDRCLGGLVDHCRRFDHWSWAKRHLEPEMRKRATAASQDSPGSPPYIIRAIQRWFPTDEELFSELDRIEQMDSTAWAFWLAHWWDTFLERGDPENRPAQMVLAWLARDQSPLRFLVAARLIGDRGKRRDLQSLLEVRPDVPDPAVDQAAANAEFAVKRRSLD